MTPQAKILIVEDEIIIADIIQGYLESKGHNVVGIAISYDEAIQLIELTSPDLVLLDIRLNSNKTGIEVGSYLYNRTEKIPHIYLSSQADAESLGKAKNTFPEAYLTKPIQKMSLLMTVEVVLHNRLQLVENHDGSLILKDNDMSHNINFKDIIYINAEHVYLRIHLVNDKTLVIRNSLKWILDQLPKAYFMQVHRSYVVNMKQVKEWSSNALIVDEKSIPISRARKKETMAFFE